MTSRGVGNWSDSKSITTIKGKGKCCFGFNQLGQRGKNTEYKPKVLVLAHITASSFFIFPCWASDDYNNFAVPAHLTGATSEFSGKSEWVVDSSSELCGMQDACPSLPDSGWIATDLCRLDSTFR